MMTEEEQKKFFELNTKLSAFNEFPCHNMTVVVFANYNLFRMMMRYRPREEAASFIEKAKTFYAAHKEDLDLAMKFAGKEPEWFDKFIEHISKPL